MRKPSIYVKMKVLGAIDVAEGRTRDERIRNVAQMTFLDEEGSPTASRGGPFRRGTIGTRTPASPA